MGYSTDFQGHWKLDKPLSASQAAYLRAFAQTRRMQRNAGLTELRPDPLRIDVGLPVGEEGGYFVGEQGMMGQGVGLWNDKPVDVTNYNQPPRGQPGLWCQWIPTKDGSAIEWDGGEKFYDYVEWITYIIEHFLKPWGYVLNGVVEWSGEESADLGEIVIVNNTVSVNEGTIVMVRRTPSKREPAE
jgi:hypothetical protein